MGYSQGEEDKKRNGVILRWCGLVLTLLTMFAAVIGGWVTMGNRTSAHASQLADHEGRLRAIESKQERILTLVEGMAVRQGITVR
jgi:hypothetical protein